MQFKMRVGHKLAMGADFPRSLFPVGPTVNGELHVLSNTPEAQELESMLGKEVIVTLGEESEENPLLELRDTLGAEIRALEAENAALKKQLDVYNTTFRGNDQSQFNQSQTQLGSLPSVGGSMLPNQGQGQ